MGVRSGTNVASICSSGNSSPQHSGCSPDVGAFMNSTYTDDHVEQPVRRAPTGRRGFIKTILPCAMPRRGASAPPHARRAPFAADSLDAAVSDEELSAFFCPAVGDTRPDVFSQH